MRHVYEFLVQGWAQPREVGTDQTIHGLLVQSGENHFEAIASIHELEARGSLTRKMPDGTMLYLWATPDNSSSATAATA